MDNKIIGQNKVQKEINRIFDVFINSHGSIRPHFILTGMSGSGKSYIIKSLTKAKGLNYIEINAAQITKEGTSGNSLSKALAPIGSFKNKLTVVFCDEFDKLFISGNSNHSLANTVTVGVQNEFLKILESDTISVFGNYGHYDNIDSSKTLFIFAGAFNNEENITLDKLRSFGLKTEFLGRVGLIYNLNKLTLDDLFMILENSELLANYLNLFVEVKREDVIAEIKKWLTNNYEYNDLGARIVHTLIHQYFIKDGKLGVEDIKEITFQNKLHFD